MSWLLEEIAKGDEKLTMFKDNLEEISNNEKVIGLYDSELAKEYENNCIKKEHEKKEKKLNEMKEQINLAKEKLNLEKEEINLEKEEINLEKEELNNRIYELAKSMLEENIDIDTIKKVTSLTEEEIKNLL